MAKFGSLFVILSLTIFFPGAALADQAVQDARTKLTRSVDLATQCHLLSQRAIGRFDPADWREEMTMGYLQMTTNLCFGLTKELESKIIAELVEGSPSLGLLPAVYQRIEGQLIQRLRSFRFPEWRGGADAEISRVGRTIDQLLAATDDAEQALRALMPVDREQFECTVREITGAQCNPRGTSCWTTYGTTVKAQGIGRAATEAAALQKCLALPATQCSDATCIAL